MSEDDYATGEPSQGTEDGSPGGMPPIAPRSPVEQSARVIRIRPAALAGTVLALAALLACVSLKARRLERAYAFAREPMARFLVADAPYADWRYIVIHHTATEGGCLRTIERYHANVRKWPRVGYHFVIGNGSQSGDGCVEPTRTWKRQLEGIHAGSREYNQYGIAVSLVGNFENDRPTPRQMDALVALCAGLVRTQRIAIGNVTYHKRIRPTKCPGRFFPYETFERRLARATGSRR